MFLCDIIEIFNWELLVLSQQIFVLVKMSWRRREDVDSIAIIYLQDVLEDEMLLRFFMTKTDNRFVIPLDFGYVQHHYNAKGSWYICRLKSANLQGAFGVTMC